MAVVIEDVFKRKPGLLMHRPRREWTVSRRCACGACRYMPFRECPAVNELNPGEALWVSSAKGVE